MSRRKNKLVPFETIVLATQGDPQALEQVIRHYRPYILSLCRREYIAEKRQRFHRMRQRTETATGSEANGKKSCCSISEREDI